MAEATLPSGTSIIYSAPALEIVCSPRLVGAPLAALARAASADWLRSLLPGALGERAVSLEVLNGGHYYYVADACAGTFGSPCAVASLRAKRSRDDAGAWTVKVWDRSGASLAGATAVLVGDTLATGTTLAGVLTAVLDELQAAGSSPLPPVDVFAIAGAAAAERALAPVGARLAAGGGALHITFANAAFSLWSDGTDLRFTGTDARWHPAAAAELAARLCGWDAANIKCACFDWGDRMREPDVHLKELDAWVASLGSDAPPWQCTAVREALAAPPAPAV